MEQLAAVLHDTELCLEERSRLVQDLELAISEKASALETLKKEKHSKTEEVAKAQQVRGLVLQELLQTASCDCRKDGKSNTTWYTHSK